MTEEYSTTIPHVQKRDIITMIVNTVPVEFYVNDIIDGIPYVSVLTQYMNNVEYTEYRLGAVEPIRKGQEYEVVDLSYETLEDFRERRLNEIGIEWKK